MPAYNFIGFQSIATRHFVANVFLTFTCLIDKFIGIFYGQIHNASYCPSLLMPIEVILIYVSILPCLNTCIIHKEKRVTYLPKVQEDGPEIVYLCVTGFPFPLFK